MDEEEKKIRYAKIVTRLRTIYNRIESLENDLDDLKTINEDTLTINDLGVGSKKITAAKNYADSASKVIDDTIIPRLNEKIDG